MGTCFSQPEAAHDSDTKKPQPEAPPRCEPPKDAPSQQDSSTEGIKTSDLSLGLPYESDTWGPPLPPCEDERRATMKALNLHNLSVEAPPDPEIENILRLVASIFQAPNALVALFDDQRIFIRESQGAFCRGDFPWRYSFCGWTMQSEQDQIMVIPDATKDARFKNNKMVTREDGVRFYCGAPLIASNGHRLGTLCFADTKPRDFDAAQASILSNFAEMVVRHVEKDIALQLVQNNNDVLSQAYRNLKRTMDCFEHCVLLIDTSVSGWRVMYVNAAWEKTTGSRRDGISGHVLSDVLEAGSTPLPSKQHEELAAAGKAFVVEAARLRPGWLSEANVKRSIDSANGTPSMSSGSRYKSPRLLLKLRPAWSIALDDDTVALAVPAWVANNKPTADVTSHLYFMTVEDADSIPNSSSRFSLARSSRAVGALNPTSPVQGLQLGALLGTGSFGSVYAGHWYGTPVAIKVIDQDIKQLQAAGAQMEAILGSELRHPHIVATLTYEVHQLASPGANSGTFSDDSAREPACVITPASRTPASKRSLPPVPDCESPVDGLQNDDNAAGRGSATTTRTDSATRTQEGADSSVLGVSGPNAQSAVGAAGPTSYVPVVSAGANVQSGAQGGEAQGQTSTITFPVAHKQGEFLSQADSDLHGSYYALANEFALSPVLSVPAAAAASNGGRQQTWIVLEFCDKGTLQDAVDRGWLNVPDAPTKTPNMGAVVSTASEVASALLYLHSHGVVHGDLSAWNVLLTTTGASALTGGRGFTAKVADFGMSRALDIQSRIQTRTYGTITHQPPETLLQGMVSRETDTYSLGVLLWQMYTGTRPWAGMTHAQIIMTVASKSAHLAFPPDTPPEYLSLAQACMSYDVTERPAMAQVCRELEAMKAKYAPKPPPSSRTNKVSLNVRPLKA